MAQTTLHLICGETAERGPFEAALVEALNELVEERDWGAAQGVLDRVRGTFSQYERYARMLETRAAAETLKS